MAIKSIKPRGIYMWATYDELVEIQSTTKKTYDNALASFNALNVLSNNSAIITAQNSAKTALHDAAKDYNAETEARLNEAFENKTSVPFLLAGVQSVDFQWTHSLGQAKGLSAVFLQPWYNEPVNITVTGLSYIGAWGGTTVDTQMQAAIADAKFEATKKGSLDRFVAGAQNILNIPNVLAQKATDYVAGGVASVMNTVNKLVSILQYAKQKPLTGPIKDDTISNLKNLISFLNHGPDGSMNKNYKNIKVTLLLENEPGADGSYDNYASFDGFITGFSYKEDIMTPYLYEWSFTFVGDPQIKSMLNGKVIEAKQNIVKFGVNNTGITGSSKDLFTLG